MVGEYTDEKTGRNSDREAFQQLFLDGYQKKYDLVCFWALDRFSREGAGETLRHLQKLTSYGILWKSCTEPYIDSAGVFSDVIVSLLATVAKQESVRRSERASAAYAKLKQQNRTDHLGRWRHVHQSNWGQAKGQPHQHPPHRAGPSVDAARCAGGSKPLTAVNRSTRPETGGVGLF